MNVVNNDFNLAVAYEEQDMAETELFKGGYINFGFWDGINLDKEITEEERIETSKNLYREIINRANISNGNKILEVGCGRGYGASSLIKTFSDSQVIGMDFLRTQIQKACHFHQDILEKNNGLVFVEGKAEDIPFCNDYFDSIISVEAAQHFRCIESFLLEAKRVLKNNGRLVFTTFFSKLEGKEEKLKELFPFFAQGVDQFMLIDSVCNRLKEIGFNAHYESIGNDVWYGFDKWLEQTDHHDQWGRWGRHWLKAYHEGLVDYYIISAVKQA